VASSNIGGTVSVDGDRRWGVGVEVSAPDRADPMPASVFAEAGL